MEKLAGNRANTMEYHHQAPFHQCEQAGMTSGGDGGSASGGEVARDLCLFVANLPGSFNNEELEHHLRSLLGRFGIIVSAKASRDSKQRPFCFVQFSGEVDGGIFGEVLYLGGRALRLEKSRVRSGEKQQLNRRRYNESPHYSLGSPPLHPANYAISPSPHSSSNITLSPPEVWAPSPPGFIPSSPPHPAYIPAPLFYPLMISGLPNDGSVTRKMLFLRFKVYGFIHGIDLCCQADGTITSVIYFDNPISFDSALRSVSNDGNFGGVGVKLECGPTPSWQ